MSEMTEKAARRAAYAAYVECFWSMWRLPSGDARRPALALATQRAEAAWRASMARTTSARGPACTPRRPVTPSPAPADLHLGEALTADDH